ncbi:hypothetical protein D9615_002321 [Tricholomella constricta]|uniref:Uncharacterized protein n=1 Tax=Tricholomella constricta TaxID=117010 RepID=A0A8H5HMK2_9AGAR|nr:hypothetical protein D9615_002321 [Tricholomella constricta]
MPINIPGLLVPFQLLFNPRVVLPSVVVKVKNIYTIFAQQDLRHLDFAALRKAGYRGAVFDKDNCLTRPHKDTVVPEIQEAWDECRSTFGEGNVLIVSNSAGTWLDPGGIQCESVTHNTGVPVLRHKSFKPAYSCITTIRGYFSSLRFPIRDDELIIVGDRIFTDVVMANRMRGSNDSLRSPKKDGGALGKVKNGTEDRPRGPLAIWTTDVWEKEAMVMRWCEKKLVDVVRHWSHSGGQELDTSSFVKEFVEPKPLRTSGMMAGLFGRLRSS